MKEQFYYRLVSDSREKCRKLSEMTFKEKVKVNKLGAFYYSEIFIYEDVFQTQTDIPRHLLFDGSFLLCIRYDYFVNSCFETLIYADGEVRKTVGLYDDCFINSKGHVTYIDFALILLKAMHNKELTNALNAIKGTKLYEGIINERFFVLMNEHNNSIYNDFKTFVSLNYQHFEKCKNWEYKEFYKAHHKPLVGDVVDSG